MSKKGSFWDNPFGGLFDFNGDGKEDIGEQWFAFKMFDEITKTEDDGVGSIFGDSNVNYNWRNNVEEDYEFGLDAYDYDTEEEYNEALEEAKYGWRKTAEEGYEFGLNPYNFETEEEYNEALDEAKHAWREKYEEDYEFDLDPYDYDTEEEYKEDLEDTKYGWRKTAEYICELDINPEDYETEEEYREALVQACSDYGYDFSDTGELVKNDDAEEEIKESDYPNKRQYNAAVALSEHYFANTSEEYEEKEKSRYRFILEQNDKIIAANYLTAYGYFLFSQAIKDNFDVPVTLPDEDESKEFPLEEILKKIHKKDVPLTLKIWDWCIEQFLPYADYSLMGREEMTNCLLDSLYIFSDKFHKSFREYLNDHADFRTKLVRQSKEMPNNLSEIIVNMIMDGFTKTAKAMFDDGLFRSEGKWKQVNSFMDGLIFYSKNYEELETIEFVEQNFLPKIKQFSDGMILDEVEGWQQEITEYKQEVERRSEKYAFSRSNAWRKTVPDGSKYGLEPRYYDTEQEYLDALQKKKYAWRDWAVQRDTLGLDLTQFETEEEYTEAWQSRYDEQQAKKRKEQAKQRETELLTDKTIYTYCGVMLPFSEQPYFFRTDDTTLKIGDRVIVPIGEENKEMQGTIVSIGQYARIGTPYPPKKTKFILRKKSENNA